MYLSKILINTPGEKFIVKFPMGKGAVIKVLMETLTSLLKFRLIKYKFQMIDFDIDLDHY